MFKWLSWSISFPTRFWNIMKTKCTHFGPWTFDCFLIFLRNKNFNSNILWQSKEELNQKTNELSRAYYKTLELEGWSMLTYNSGSSPGYGAFHWVITVPVIYKCGSLLHIKALSSNKLWITCNLHLKSLFLTITIHLKSDLTHTLSFETSHKRTLTYSKINLFSQMKS